MRKLIAVLAWILALALPVQAQRQVAVMPVQDLSFGLLYPNVPVTVSPSDAGSRGELTIDGNGTVGIQISLPTELVGPGGATLSVRFGYGDAAYAETSSSPLIVFDPHTPQQVHLPGNTSAGRLFIGGTAQPTAQQPVGTYSAPIVVIVANPNS